MCLYHLFIFSYNKCANTQYYYILLRSFLFNNFNYSRYQTLFTYIIIIGCITTQNFTNFERPATNSKYRGASMQITCRVDFRVRERRLWPEKIRRIRERKYLARKTDCWDLFVTILIDICKFWKHILVYIVI